MTNTLAITKRVYTQLIRDKRFFVLSLIAPLLVTYLLKITLDALPTFPGFSNEDLVMAAVAALVFFLSYMLCALALVRERTQETLNRMFINGYRRGNIVTGYILGFTGLATMQTVLALIEANYIYKFGYSLTQQLSFFIVIWLLAMISVMLGIFFSNFARTEGQALPFIPLVLIPSIFLSGLLTDGANNMVAWARAVSYFVPLRYANDIIQSLVTGGSLTEHGWALLVLVTWIFGLLGLAALTLKERE